MGRGLLKLSAAVNDKKDKLFNQFQKLDAKDEENEDFKMIAEVVEELVAQPCKIRPCRRAVLSNVWDPEKHQIASLRFWQTVGYIHRIPKDWVTGHSSGAFKMIERKNKGVLHRLLCHFAALELNSPLPTRVQDDFFDFCEQRKKECGPPTFSASAEILNWSQIGWYKLLPPLPSGTEPKDHMFSRVSVLESSFVADLPD